ncbi:MAG: carbohydrate ABC transporter permease [Treponemataceae bacterium]|nr:MAG: carbohydrate ABC transporter permease [Treponemataceae bacterium]
MNRNKRRTMIIATVIAIILGVFFLFPIYYLLMQSVTPWKMVDKSIFPTGFSLDSFNYLVNNGGSGNKMMWLRAVINSLFVTIICTGVCVVTGVLTSYAMTKIRFKATKIMYNILLFQMFFPGVILLVPLYMLLRPFVNNYLGLIIPYTVSLWAIMLYYNYFRALPSDVFESARIDGASELRIAFTIAFPICRTISAIVFLSIFLGRWSELMWDMLMAPSLQMQTLNVLIATQFKPMGNMPGPLYAASAILTLPVVILFLCFSKNFKQGISMQFK